MAPPQPPRGAPRRDVRRAVAWGPLAPLRLRARELADGALHGRHRSRRRGSGVEFAGHREYVVGDDLRLLDQKASARHGTPLVRELEMETERTLMLWVDASASMLWRSERAQVDKLAWSAYLAAALAWVAVAGGDRVGLAWLGASDLAPLRPQTGRLAFERVVDALEAVDGSVVGPDDAARALEQLDALTRRSRGGTLIVLLSDLLDADADLARDAAALGAGDRRVVVLHTLDPREEAFDFQGPVRLRASESGVRVDTDADAARAGYLAALQALRDRWRQALAVHGGELVPCQTLDAPERVVLRVLEALGGVTR